MEDEDTGRTTRTVDAVEMEFDVPVGGALSTGREARDLGRRTPPRRMPGRRVADGRERVANASMADVRFQPGGMDTVATMMANLAGGGDEVDAATARSMMDDPALEGSRAVMLGAPDATTEGHVPPTMIESPVGGAGGVVVVDPPVDAAPGTFLAVLNDEPFDVVPAWLSVHQLPGYGADHIRGLARNVFRSFPCFVEQERHGRLTGRDGLADVGALCGIPGAAVSDMAEIDAAARWIIDNGAVIDAGRMTVAPIPGYRPRVVLACTEDESLLLVQEDAEARGPVAGGAYVYRWNGGRAFYARNPEAAASVTGMMATTPGAGRRLAAPVRALAAPRGPEGGDGAAAPGRAVVPRGSDLAGARRAPLRVGRAPRKARGLAHEIRDMGFGMEPGPAGAVLTLVEGDLELVAVPTDDVPLPRATALEVVATRDGIEVARAECASRAEVEAFAEAARAPAPPSPF